LHPTNMLNFRSVSINKLIVIKHYWAWLCAVVIIAYGPKVYSQAPNISYTTPQTYTVNTVITALSPINSGGVVPTTFGAVSTFAGNSTFAAINGVGTAASFNYPQAAACDVVGNIYVADYSNILIRKITPTGLVSTYAGNGSQGSANGAAATATFFEPTSIAIDGAGNIYIADLGNNMIRKISSAGVVSTLAGSILPGASDGIGTAASFNGPTGVAVDGTGNVYVADKGNYVIRKITPAGLVTTFAGSGTLGSVDGTGAAASFNTPQDLTVDATGNIYVVDYTGNAIRKITTAGVVTTIAGNGTATSVDGLGLAASFNRPIGITINNSGYLFVSDFNGNQIRVVSPAGLVTTLPSITGSFSGPDGAGFDSSGNLYIAQVYFNIISKVVTSGYYIDKPLPTGLSFDPTTGIISGTPTAVSPSANYTITAYNGSGNSTTVVNIQVLASTLIQSVITFPQIPTNTGSDILTPGATSNNNEMPITYTSSNTAVAIITAGGLIQLVGPGTTTITASQAGDANYSAATPVSQQMIVTENQVITFPAIAAKATCDADFPAGATSSNSTIPLTYASSNLGVATISATGLIHIVGAGSTTITISQAGNTLFNPANPVSQVLTVGLPATPAVTIAASTTSVCAGMPVMFTATVSNIPGTANLIYQWQVNGVNVSTNATYTSTILASTDVVNCIVTNTAHCGQAGTSNSISGIIVTPYITPSITITSSATAPVCPGTNVTYSATVTNAGTNPTYQWQVNGTTYGTGTSQINYVSSNNTDQVTCILINNSSPCLTSAVVQSNAITTSIISPANPAPSITISSSNNGQYPGVPITFTAVSSNAGIGLAYQWQVNGINAGPDNTVFTTGTLNNGDQVTCILIINHGCIPTLTSNTVVADIIAPPAVTLTNTFTPNGDGINDLWLIPDLVNYPNCLVTIFTRYGTQIFQSKGYSKPWDGTYKGSLLPMGTYYYLINLGDKSPALSGWIAIVR